MNLPQLKTIAEHHEVRASLLVMKEREAADAGLSRQERDRLKTKRLFHEDAAKSLRELAHAFEILIALTGR